ncbi:molybdopterin-dependent oxidoreductase [Synechococcus sp. PCC 7336]|uniref:molybdopterin-dependent oxidoreductase n=1 Tax=Synechococcus sp. PCC 7336 TaxID=195250 RepID=UPI001D0D5110|nr:molybdopterin-dependent oxidoreductase [Synechococcus sp. PCC 7336]
MASVWTAGGLVLLQPRSQAITQDGRWPLLDLRDFSQPLPEHWVTPTSDFYIQSAFGTPELDRDRWKLELSGLLDRPLSLSFTDLLSLPAEDIYWTLECIGNPAGGQLAGNALWRGTRLRPLLERAGVRPEARAFALRSADEYETGLLRQELLQEDVFLVYRMNGEPLPPEHGYPVRIFIPGKYGQKQPKWLTQIEAIAEPFRGYWERRGWSDRAPILTHGLARQVQRQRVFTGNKRVQSPPGWVAIAGMALASNVWIDRVEVSRDGGSIWEIAEQTRPSTPYEWTVWRHQWFFIAPGQHQLLARAVAGEDVQPLNDIIPLDGNQAILQVQLEVSDRSPVLR